jgi:hypothetical protein
MPFIRQTRDKRGMEQTYVMHAYRSGTGEGMRTRVLYMFRTPAGLRIGRTVLDPEVREALEHTHPDLTFDWQALTREATLPRAEPTGPRRTSRPRSERPPSAEADRRDTGSGGDRPPDERRRIKGRYRELEERITRRARTPEDRDRLLERLRRLNPDDWTDPSSTRIADVGREFDAIVAELPSRRRNRRGGRDRSRPEGASAGSGIMAGGYTNENQGVDEGAEPPGDDQPGGDSGSLGAADPTGPAAADLPVDDRLRHD